MLTAGGATTTLLYRLPGPTPDGRTVLLLSPVELPEVAWTGCGLRPGGWARCRLISETSNPDVPPDPYPSG
jgi:hypothetical protein